MPAMTFNIGNVGRFENDTVLLDYLVRIDHRLLKRCQDNVCLIDHGQLPLFYQLYDIEDIKAFDLIMTRGTWRDHSWGEVPSLMMHNISSHGAFIATDIHHRSKDNGRHSYRLYTSVRNMLASSICGSINVDTLGSKPIKVKRHMDSPTDTWMQFFPSETLCSDQSIALLKILPYDSVLETLLSSKVMLSSPWYSFQIHVSKGSNHCNFISNDTSNSIEHICMSNVTTTLRVSTILQPGYSKGHKKTVKKLKEIRNHVNTSDDNDSNKMHKRIKVNRIIRDSRQLRLYVETQVENVNNYPVSIHVIDVIPNFYDILLNTYQVCYRLASGNDCHNNEQVTNLESFLYNNSSDSCDDNCFDSLSWSFELPPKTMLVASYIGMKQFMHMNAFPPDASRGIEVPPSIIYHNNFPYERIITTSHLVSLPLSDFSMSFNVVTLVSTSFVFLVGTLINTLLRRKEKKL